MSTPTTSSPIPPFPAETSSAYHRRPFGRPARPEADEETLQRLKATILTNQLAIYGAIPQPAAFTNLFFPVQYSLPFGPVQFPPVSRDLYNWGAAPGAMLQDFDQSTHNISSGSTIFDYSYDSSGVAVGKTKDPRKRPPNTPTAEAPPDAQGDTRSQAPEIRSSNLDQSSLEALLRVIRDQRMSLATRGQANQETPRKSDDQQRAVQPRGHDHPGEERPPAELRPSEAWLRKHQAGSTSLGSGLSGQLDGRNSGGAVASTGLLSRNDRATKPSGAERTDSPGEEGAVLEPAADIYPGRRPREPLSDYRPYERTEFDRPWDDNSHSMNCESPSHRLRNSSRFEPYRRYGRNDSPWRAPQRLESDRRGYDYNRDWNARPYSYRDRTDYRVDRDGEYNRNRDQRPHYGSYRDEISSTPRTRRYSATSPESRTRRAWGDEYDPRSSRRARSPDPPSGERGAYVPQSSLFAPSRVRPRSLSPVRRDRDRDNMSKPSPKRTRDDGYSAGSSHSDQRGIDERGHRSSYPQGHRVDERYDGTRGGREAGKKKATPRKCKVEEQ